MSSGFNTDIRVGERVFHVQTEDRGASYSAIDTAVYHSGRVVHRRSSSYREFHESPDFTPEALRRRVEAQHRLVIEDLRSGSLNSEIAAAEQQARNAAGIQVQLLNPTSWLSAGSVSLILEILRRADNQPESGARVEAVIEGALEEARHAGMSDEQGRVQIEFPMPPLGKGDLALVIQARANAGKDELRFAMRSRTKPPPSDGAP
ncbi:MAG TPA: hypothetical protein VLY23_08295 [Candidatus Acidoferrum sp.]|nr:hypothetical protein [Candidatus Acidoferrum sp.]